MKTMQIKITIPIPRDATKREVAEYVHDAVCTWKGQFRPDTSEEPGDPLHYLNTDAIVIEWRENRKTWFLNSKDKEPMQVKP